ncbi:MAG TPA: hypothetical protein VH724_08510 [Candidatus Angelobacter sp.]|nr:hypothetical protein [Candidatus Angelobacter sp.]
MRKSSAVFLFVLAIAVYFLVAHATFKPEIDPIWPDESGLPSDCAVDAGSLPQGASRVYIALRDGDDGSGASATNARDGSTAQAFDTILRCYSEGCSDSQNSGKPVAKTENLIVCLGEGAFSTMGAYDFIIAVPHTTANGFTMGK